MILAAMTALALLMAGAPSGDEAVILSNCIDRGASEAECACGLDAAREIMTPREMGLVAALAPDLSGETEVEAALIRAMQVAQERGFSLEEFFAAAQKVEIYAAEVEARCAGAGQDG